MLCIFFLIISKQRVQYRDKKILFCWLLTLKELNVVLQTQCLFCRMSSLAKHKIVQFREQVIKIHFDLDKHSSPPAEQVLFKLLSFNNP